MGIKVIDVEISEPLKPLKLLDYQGNDVWALLKLRGEPLGWLKFNYEDLPISAKELATLITRYHTWPIYEQSLRRMLDSNQAQLHGKDFLDWAFYQPDPIRSYPKISALVLLNDKTEFAHLQACLAALRQQNHPDYEILMAAYQPPHSTIIQLAEEAGATVVTGAGFFSRAVEQASGEFVAITGQMAIPDKGWLRAIATVADNPQLVAVTGAFFPYDMDNDAQVEFEKQVRRPNWFVRYYNYDEVYSIPPENFGIALNNSFRRSFLLNQAADTVQYKEFSIQPMLQLYYRALEQGYIIGYEPQAIIKERYPTQMPEVWQQLEREGRERIEFMRAVGGGLSRSQMLKMQLKTTLRSNPVSARLIDRIRGKA